MSWRVGNAKLKRQYKYIKCVARKLRFYLTDTKRGNDSRRQMNFSEFFWFRKWGARRGCVFSGKTVGPMISIINTIYYIHLPFTISEIAAFFKERLRLRALSDKNWGGNACGNRWVGFASAAEKILTTGRTWKYGNASGMFTLSFWRVYKPVLFSQLTSHFSVVEVIRKTIMNKLVNKNPLDIEYVVALEYSAI